MIVHLIDGTYELFRHFYGIRRCSKAPTAARRGRRRAAARSLQMLEGGATHIGVATDHVIESFRNDLWPGYKTGAGIEPRAVGAVPSARGSAGGDGRRGLADGRARGRRRARLRGTSRGRATTACEKVCIWTPDKDLAQCVVGDRVVQVDRRERPDPRRRRRAREVRRRAGATSPTTWRWSATPPTAIPASPASARRRPPRLHQSPRRDRGLSRRRPGRPSRAALLFKTLATLRTDAPLFDDVDQLRWRRAGESFAADRRCKSAIRSWPAGSRRSRPPRPRNSSCVTVAGRVVSGLTGWSPMAPRGVNRERGGQQHGDGASGAAHGVAAVRTAGDGDRRRGAGHAGRHRQVWAAGEDAVCPEGLRPGAQPGSERG